MPTSESGVDPMMVLSSTSICACTRTWSVTFSVGSRRRRRFAAPRPLVPQRSGLAPTASGGGQLSGTGNGGSPLAGCGVTPLFVMNDGTGCCIVV